MLYTDIIHLFGHVHQVNKHCDDDDDVMMMRVGVLEVRKKARRYATPDEWGFICDRGWDHEAAQVACRRMNFVHGRASPGVHRASEGSKYLLK